ncbi:MAG: ribosomal protein S18-alanine N-acetyltransferase [Alphaproteobacteria bacterium]|nr:ribosomal protein S18-alanine N-acetyltransferase [Alphaproteobacteria bacterium]
METRLVLLADASALAALHAESFGVVCWSLAQLADSLALKTTRAWLAVEGSVPRGFILCQFAGDEAEILTFCVAPLARGRGVGKKLLDAAIAFSRQNNAHKLFLEVAADNTAALALYEKQGFRMTGRRRDYYKRGDQAVDAVMLTLGVSTP